MSCSQQVPLRQYPSLQIMRHVEGPHIPVDHKNKKFQNQLNRTYDMEGSPVGIRDFQIHHWSPSRRPSTPRPSTSSKVNINTMLPPLPDVYQGARHVTEITRSD